MSKDPFTRGVTTDMLCQEIAEVLATCSGEFIAEIANKVLSDKVTYLTNDIFMVEDADAAELREALKDPKMVEQIRELAKQEKNKEK